jgi:hypothetical protein
MSANDELARFVKEAMAQGVPSDEIRKVLLDAGWSEPQVSQALSGFAPSPFGFPVPRPRTSEAREAFIYLVLFATMYLGAFNLGNLAFQFINRGFPVPGQQDFRIDEAIRWAASILIVALPVFFFLTRMTNRAIRKDPSRRASDMCRKLTYLTLVLSSFLLLGIFSSVVYSFLGNALTARFVLKALTAGLIATGVFWYHLKDVRDDAANSAPTQGGEDAGE